MTAWVACFVAVILVGVTGIVRSGRELFHRTSFWRWPGRDRRRATVLSRWSVAFWRDPSRAFLCGVCGGQTEPGHCYWSRALNAYVDHECVPAILRRDGWPAMFRWLDTGEVGGLRLGGSS